MHRFRVSATRSVKCIALNAGRTAAALCCRQVSPRLQLRTEGSSLVEMALTLPVVLIIMTGISLSPSVSTSGCSYQPKQSMLAWRTLAFGPRAIQNPCTTTSNVIYAAAPGLAKGKPPPFPTTSTESNRRAPRVQLRRATRLAPLPTQIWCSVRTLQSPSPVHPHLVQDQHGRLSPSPPSQITEQVQ